MKISAAIHSLTGHKQAAPAKAIAKAPAKAPAKAIATKQDFATLLQRTPVKAASSTAAQPTGTTPATAESATRASGPTIVLTAGSSLMPQGDAANPMRGYVSAAGGTFGLGDTADRSQALRALEAISGIDSGTTYASGTYAGGDPTKFGLPANATAADVNALRSSWALVANGDPAGVQAGISSANPMLRQVAQAEAARHPELLLPNAFGRRA